MSIRPPEDADRAALAGRVWRDDAGGPSVVALREGRLVDVTPAFPTMTDLLTADDPAAALRAAPGEDLGPLEARDSLLGAGRSAGGQGLPASLSPPACWSG